MDVNISIHINLLLIDPFALDGFKTIRQVNQVPNLIVSHGLYLGSHGDQTFLRVWVHHRFCIGCMLIII